MAYDATSRKLPSTPILRIYQFQRWLCMVETDAFGTTTSLATSILIPMSLTQPDALTITICFSTSILIQLLVKNDVLIMSNFLQQHCWFHHFLPNLTYLLWSSSPRHYWFNHTANKMFLLIETDKVDWRLQHWLGSKTRHNVLVVAIVAIVNKAARRPPLLPSSATAIGHFCAQTSPSTSTTVLLN